MSESNEKEEALITKAISQMTEALEMMESGEQEGYINEKLNIVQDCMTLIRWYRGEE
ncbi:MAG: hypothetical protein ABII27_00100 [bacterium]